MLVPRPERHGWARPARQPMRSARARAPTTLEELEREMVAMAQAGFARDLKMAGLEAYLKELNDRLGVASRHHTAMIHEVDGRLRTHIDSVVRDISDATQAADNRVRNFGECADGDLAGSERPL